MAMVIKSEVAARKHELIRKHEKKEISQEEYDKQMMEILQMEKNNLEQSITETKDNTTKVEEEVEQATQSIKKKDKRRLYREAIALYRQSKELVLRSRAMKKQLREWIKDDK